MQDTIGNPLERQDTAGNCYQCSAWRKRTVLFVASWMTLAATFSSTSLLSVADEIASEFSTSPVSVNVSSGALLLAMGLSSFVWGPISIVTGKRVAYIACASVLMLFTIGVALAPTMPVFVLLRILSGLQGTYFHVAGQAILARYFCPVERGTATGFFLAGSVLGPPLGPCVAGLIVTFQSWRMILWLQAGMVGLGVVMSFFVIHFPAVEDQRAPSLHDARKMMSSSTNPLNVFRLMASPSILLTDLTCGILSWSQYSLLSAPRHIISNRFHLTSPLYSGLFYIAPAAGFLLGTLVGGRYSDRTVKKYISKRDGLRLPQDRLNSGMWSFFLVVPVASLVYGWGMGGKDDSMGWLALPIIAAFFIAAGLLAAFASLNTFCAEIRPLERMPVIAGKYFVQYTFGALAIGSAIPIIDAIGVGLSSTISAILVLVAGCLTLSTARRGELVRTKKTAMEKLFHKEWCSSASSSSQFKQ